MLLECMSVSKVYPGRNGSVRALGNVSFRAEAREFLCIVGPSGCGKTTLLKIIAELLRPTSGQVFFSEQASGGHRRAAMVFQEHGLFPWMTVLQNAAFGLEMQGIPRAERRRRAGAFVEQLGLGPFASSYPHELSVGMRQRVSIARAFLADPQVLLMDEPLGSVDAQTKRVLQQELLAIWQEHRKLVVYVTHDIEEAVILADKVLVMTGRPGSILEQIPIALDRPRDLRRDSAEVAETRWHIWQMLEHEVRKSLWPSR
jgi:NitT/TauT family transport system ATP-binding protein